MPATFLSMVSIVFKILKNNRIVDQSPRETWSFFDLQYGFRSSRSTADLLIVVPNKIA